MAIATIGEAYDLGWKLTVFCREDQGDDATKRRRRCLARLDADVATLVWTRGRDYPLARLEGRMKCPRCGGRRVMLAFEPPSGFGRGAAAMRG